MKLKDIYRNLNKSLPLFKIMPKEKKRIVFYSSTAPTVFLYKIGNLLKKNNYETILFTTCEKDRFDYNLYKKAFDKIICSNFRIIKFSFKNINYFLKRTPNLLKFLISLKTIKPYAIIGVAGSNWQLRLVHKYFFKKFPFIYFPYDILSHFFVSEEKALENGTSLSDIEAEKYLFENSDGIMHKGSPQELEPVKGRIFKNINLSPIQLSFMPYCSKDFNAPANQNKLSKEDNEFHIAYAGFISNNPEHITKIIQYYRDLMKQKIHMHVYLIVTHISKEEEEKYIQDLLAPVINEKYFHLYTKKFDPIALAIELSKYDFAFWQSYETNPENLEPIYAVGHKISTYLESGLPIIYNTNCIFLDDMLTKYGVSVPFNEQNLKNIKKRLKKLNYKEMVRNTLIARQDFDMDKNFLRLEKFIKDVANKKLNKINSL